MLSTLCSPKFSSYWSFYGSPDVAKHACQQIEAIPNVTIRSCFKDHLKELYAFVSKGEDDEAIKTLLESCPTLATNFIGMMRGTEEAWVQANWNKMVGVLQRFNPKSD